MTLSDSFPRFLSSLTNVSEALRPLIQILVRDLEKYQRTVAEAVNGNETYIKSVSQNAQPTVPAGEIWLWHDADAAAGQPTHYLVANDGTNTVTFASQETA